MQNFISALDKSLENKNWYSALFIALSLPDICGKLTFSLKSSYKRYVKWFDLYLKNRFTYPVGADNEIHCFLSGSDCYALRCAYLHEGTDDISKQRAREVLERLIFVFPPKKGKVHLNQSDNTLQLQVDIFCKDISSSTKNWYYSLDEKKRKEIDSQLAEIYDLSKGLSF